MDELYYIEDDPNIALVVEVNDKYYEEAAQYERKQKKFAWTKWAAMAACLCLVVAAGMVVPKLINPTPVGITSQGAVDGAPMVYVNDTLYQYGNDIVIEINGRYWLYEICTDRG